MLGGDNGGWHVAIDVPSHFPGVRVDCESIHDRRCVSRTGMWGVTGHLLRLSGGVCALIGMERCPIAGVGLRRLHHAFIVRDGADRRIQCSHVACSLT